MYFALIINYLVTIVSDMVELIEIKHQVRNEILPMWLFLGPPLSKMWKGTYKWGKGTVYQRIQPESDILHLNSKVNYGQTTENG